MNCPACGNALIVLEHDQIELDFCVNCEGIWLDAGELELLVGSAEAAAQILEVGAQQPPKSEKLRKCPICGRNMQKVNSAAENSVTYDRCDHGDGLWFDRGELAQLIGEGQLQGNGAIKDFLREVFG